MSLTKNESVDGTTLTVSAQLNPHTNINATYA